VGFRGVFLSEPTEKNTPMALNESAVSELLVALRAGDGVDRLRELAQWALQELIEAEAASGQLLHESRMFSRH
jgi:hypothetical protein